MAITLIIGMNWVLCLQALAWNRIGERVSCGTEEHSHAA